MQIRKLKNASSSGRIWKQQGLQQLDRLSFIASNCVRRPFIDIKSGPIGLRTNILA